MLDEVHRIQTQDIPTEEVAKVVKQFIAGTLAARKTMQGQAQMLGANWMAAGDLNFSERYLAAAQAITPADIQRVARQHLTPENRTLYALLPEGTEPKPAASPELFREKNIDKITLPNGLCLLLKSDRRLPFVEMRAVFRGGVLAETESRNGLTQLMAKMLLQGTAQRDAEQIASQIESIGGSIDSFGGFNSFGVTAEVLSGDFQAGLEIMADVILNPAFPPAAFEGEKRIQLETIRSQRDNLLQCCGRAMRRELFGDTGYGLDPSGTEASVENVPLADLAAFHKRLAVPNNCVLAIFGDIDPAATRKAVETVFAAWQSGDTPPPAPSGPVTLNQIKRVEEHRDKKQAVVLMAFPGASMESPDHYALDLSQEACSDLGSRLFTRIRDNLGLAYYVGAQNFMGLAPGYFAFYAGSAPEKLAQVEQELFNETQLLRSQGLSAEELKRAKAKLIGQKKIARQDLGNHAMTAALDELYGLGFNRLDIEDKEYEDVTLEQTRAIALKYLTPNAFVLSIAQPEP
jgi:zinc protease